MAWDPYKKARESMALAQEYLEKSQVYEKQIPSRTWHVSGRPSTNEYWHRITWTPGMLALSGDIGSMVVEHYSFDSWQSAIGWVRGASFDYFMEKTRIGRSEIDVEATVEGLIEDAERWLADSVDGVNGVAARAEAADLSGFRILDKIAVNFYDLTKPHARKSLIAELRDRLRHGDIGGHEVADAVEDSEDLICTYPDLFRCQLRYTAFKRWAEQVFALELSTGVETAAEIAPEDVQGNMQEEQAPAP